MRRLIRTSAENRTRAALIAVFLALIGLPFLGSFLPIDPHPATTEKRRLAEFTGLGPGLGGLAKLPQAFETYFRDHFGFRALLIELHSLIKFRLLGAGSKNVIIGKDGWLYITNPFGAVMDQHRGLTGFDAGRLGEWTTYLERRRRWFAGRGIHYLFVIVPNKPTIYPEHLPRWLSARAGETPLDQLMDHFREKPETPLLDLRPAILASKAKRRLYYQTDSHWNDLGGYLGYRAIFEKLARRFPRLERLEESDLETSRRTGYSGDLSGSLNLTGIVTETATLMRPGPGHRAREVAMGPEVSAALKQRLGPATRWKTDRPGPRLLIFGDSFSGHIGPFLRSHFSETYHVVPHVGLSMELIDIAKPDVVLQILVERSIRHPPQDDPWPPE